MEQKSEIIEENVGNGQVEWGLIDKYVQFDKDTLKTLQVVNWKVQTAIMDGKEKTVFIADVTSEDRKPVRKILRTGSVRFMSGLRRCLSRLDNSKPAAVGVTKRGEGMSIQYEVVSVGGLG